MSQATVGPRPPHRPADDPQLDRLPALVRQVRQVPAEVRRFAVTADEARQRHRIDAGLLRALLAEGLPSVGHGDDRLFDDYDLGNVALHLGLMSVRRMTIRSWASALRRNSDRERSSLRIGFTPRCPVPGHPGRCRFGVLRPGGRRLLIDGDGTGAGPLCQLDVELPGAWPQIGARARELVEELTDLQFFLLPEAIRWDPDFMVKTMIADCAGAAAWLVSEGRRRGLRARFSFGLMVSKPYSTPHCWAEFLADGIWVPQDPLMLKAMRSWTALDPAEWPLYRSTGAIVRRLCGRFTKVAAHGGIWAPLSLPTEYLTAEIAP